MVKGVGGVEERLREVVGGEIWEMDRGIVGGE